MILVIMAAGMGSRFGGLKQVEPVGPNKEFILDYSIYDAIKAGVKKVVFVIKKENYDLFRETVGKRIEDKIEVNYVFQKMEDIPKEIDLSKRQKPWGTGQAILACKDVVDDNFIVINADDFYGRDAYLKARDFFLENKDKKTFGMIGYKLVNTLSKTGSVKRGVAYQENGELKILKECEIKKEESKLIARELINDNIFEVEEDALVSMNMFCLNETIFKYLEEDFNEFFEQSLEKIYASEFLLPVSIENHIKNNDFEVKVIKTKAVWYGITYKEDKKDLVLAINNLIENKEYKSNLWNK